jgi:C4-dicarboxylate transporter, DctQ subunit
LIAWKKPWSGCVTERQPPGLLERIEQAVDRFMTGSLTVLLLGLILLGLTQIVLRNAAGISLPWADGAMRAMVLWLAMIAAAVGAARLKHIRIDIAQRWIAPRFLGTIHRLLMVGTALISMAMAWLSLRLVGLEYGFQAIAFANVPSWVVLLIVPIGFVLMASRFLVHAMDSSPNSSDPGKHELLDDRQT